MRARSLLFLVVVALVIALIAKPTGLYQEFQRAWSRRNWTLWILATVAGVYFLYGVYMMLLGE